MVGLICGGLVLGVVVGFAIYKGWPLWEVVRTMWPVVVVPPMISAGIMVLTSVHVTGDSVENRLLDRWSLSKAKASEFVRMQAPRGIFVAVLHFADGTKMRIFAAHPGIRGELEAELRRRAGATGV